ncbi:MAG: radical SAM protein [Treponema sp.]
MITDFCCAEYEQCCVCPKKCGINRNNGEKGFCGETAELRIAWAGLHFGEEPPITGKGGSGTIFITGCNLRCIFCQNFQISQQGMGKAVSIDEFIRLCLRLQEAGAENINIVTGSHAAPALKNGLEHAKKHGLCIPVLWNSSGYETVESIVSLKTAVDGWLPDIKTLDSALAEELFAASDYPATAQCAIERMAALSPLSLVQADSDTYPFGKLTSGVIVRHLALPGKIRQTTAVLQWFSQKLKHSALLSLMTQYTPVAANSRSAYSKSFDNRLLTIDEDAKLRHLLDYFAIDDGFYQELVCETDWLPDFTRVRTFSSELSKPLWHWTTGYAIGNEAAQ